MQPGTMFDFKLEMTHMTFDKSRKKRREKGDCMGEQGRKKTTWNIAGVSSAFQ